jgi:hypothetical protein
LEAISSGKSHSLRGALPLILGIAEHAGLAGAERPAFQRSLLQLIAKLKRAYPNTPLLLLSPLSGEINQAAAAAIQSQGGDVVGASCCPDGVAGASPEAADALTVHHCQLLLSIRNERARAWQLEGLPQDLAPGRGILDPPEIGPVARLSISAVKNDGHDGFDVCWPESLKDNKGRLRLETVFRAFDDLNGDLQRIAPQEE